MGHMSSSHQFAIMSLHAGQESYHEVCANYLSHSAISSIDSGKGSRSQIVTHFITLFLTGLPADPVARKCLQKILLLSL